ncbi:phage shock protein operon transcriptional activator [Teredinibacter franksiae]|uniref:phage shock protein operon transcriptional activator n=1 Tax=Teredinibacter franksiae TaxID=2761453 RepID=UPI0016262E0D|nr:phage shock protein operon transcriptional activator [Teredinibacter franksiae]
MANPHTPPKVIGESNAFLEVLEQVSQMTQLNRPVLVIGERGTGKELIAERLHYLSDRWSKSLIKMNCAALNQELLESELFGHEAGAFTGASKLHKGRFERADGGTLFLDEVGTMSMRTQEKLLRFVEYGEYERLGGSSTLTADVRLVAATNVDLPELADEGMFRHDLLDRLAFDVVTLPPLRARHEDILLLAEHYALSMAKELGLPFFSGFSPEAVAQLHNHPWPGNVRELKNVIERSVARWGAEPEPIEEIQIDPFSSPYRLQRKTQPKIAHLTPTPPATAKAPAVKPELQNLPLDFKEEVENFEKRLLDQALKEARFNQRKAAELLGLSYHQLRGSLKKYSLAKEADAQEN